MKNFRILAVLALFATTLAALDNEKSQSNAPPPGGEKVPSQIKISTFISIAPLHQDPTLSTDAVKTPAIKPKRTKKKRPQ
ncbi:MAG: hypothetical protein A2901_07625 [Elusimicrobia bacterium RIFCSPLOWO2_01_FULL_54_10]|nr:MAG: hypothetical protein A2901_07625 [Elusimicrobia bacterium RIFCSPLOWO2_01_FULL_54_10]